MKHLETTVQVRDSSFQFLPYGNAGANASLRTPLRMTFQGYKASVDWDFKTCVYTVGQRGGGYHICHLIRKRYKRRATANNTHYSALITHYSLLITHYSPLYEFLLLILGNTNQTKLGLNLVVAEVILYQSMICNHHTPHDREFLGLGVIDKSVAGE